MNPVCEKCGASLTLGREQCSRCGHGEVPDEGTLPPATRPPSTLPTDPAAANEDEARLADLLGRIAAQSHFEDRYELRAELARGGMGCVYRAYDHILRREVAVKVMLRGEAPAARGQFLKEARVGGRLLHPHVLSVFDLGVNRAGQLYYTMRLVDGASLQRCLAALDTGVSTKLVTYPLRKLVGAFLGVCRGIDFAHQNRVLHLDLKPANVLMSGFEEVFVIDWGLARVDDVDDTDQLLDLYRPTSADLAAARFDQTGPAGPAIGTPAYMAPEQAGGHTGLFGPPTDVYGLGGILHYILYGTPPNRGSSLTSVLVATETAKARSPLRRGILPRGRRIEPGVRDAVAALEGIALKALDPDRARRHQTAEELVVELDEWLATAPV